MIPGMGMNPKQMAQAMKAMGIKQKELNAEEVIIKTADKELVITSPKVVEIEMQGITTYQVVGNIEERNAGVNPDDVKMVAEQANVDTEKAKAALEKANGDIAQAIMELNE